MPEERLIDDAALWKRNRELQIEDYEVPEENDMPGLVDIDAMAADPSEPANDKTTDITAKDVRNDANALKLAQPTAKLCVSVMDVLLPSVVSYFGGIDKQEFKLDDDERETLTEAFAVYLKDKDFELSPGTVLIMSIAGVYVPKFMLLIAIKKGGVNGAETKD